MSNGYHAERAKKPVGLNDWNGGELILSRWDKPVEVVPWEEVADAWVEEFKERGVEFDIVPPKLLPILMERGVEILPPHKGMGKACNDAYREKVLGENPDGPQGGVRVDNAKFKDIKPIGHGAFGEIYDQFNGNVKDAVAFLMEKRGGDLLGVFHRDDIGDIDLVWGSHEKKEGLEHIIKKHIDLLHDFSSIEEAMDVAESVIKNGKIARENTDKANIDYNGYRVSVKKQLRDDKGNVVGKKNWVVTAFDTTRTQRQKETDSSSGTLTTPPTNLKADGVTLPSNESIPSADKGTEDSGTVQGNGALIGIAKHGQGPISTGALQ